MNTTRVRMVPVIDYPRWYQDQPKKKKYKQYKKKTGLTDFSKVLAVATADIEKGNNHAN